MMGEPKLGIDIHECLIKMWHELQSGWIPPDAITEEEYQHLRDSNEISALRGFAGFACSYGGKWFAGYARQKGKNRNYCLYGKNTLLHKIPFIVDSTFINSSYDIIDGVEGALIYCDPPYKQTTGFGSYTFDHSQFWDFCRVISSRNTVVVSEMQAPLDFQSVADIDRIRGISVDGREHLYMMRVRS